MGQKTFKRELAVLLLVWLVYIVETKDANIIEILVWPVFTFAAAAFGFDQYSKLQRNPSKPSNRQRTQRSSQYASREDQLPDDWDDK